MTINVDKKNDALYFRLAENRIAESTEVRPGVILNLDEQGNVVGFELLGISTLASTEDLSSMHFHAV